VSNEANIKKKPILPLNVSCITGTTDEDVCKRRIRYAMFSTHLRTGTCDLSPKMGPSESTPNETPFCINPM
jgi:hypothetical protein